MNNRQRHEMILEQTHLSSVQKWSCPTCGQSLLVIWLPRFMTVIRKAGDKAALHALGNYQRRGLGHFMTLDKARSAL
jgi:hypothetical protein